MWSRGEIPRTGLFSASLYQYAAAWHTHAFRQRVRATDRAGFPSMRSEETGSLYRAGAMTLRCRNKLGGMEP